MAGFKVWSDASKKRLYIQMQGALTLADTTGAANAVIAEANKFSSGFDLITDLSKLEPLPAEASAEIGRAQTYMKQHGVRRVIRVLSYASVGAQFSRESDKAGYKADSAPSVDAAERMLDAG